MTITHARYQEALADLYQRTTQGIKLGLENTHQLLRALGNPHHQMRHVVVAGTNGKGSTSSLLSQVLVEAGIETGLYTSPHLLRFTERIRVNGKEISRDKVLEYYQRIRAVEDQCDALPTFFEIATAMALLCFAEAKVEIAVMEVGLGGRLDSTNVVKKSLSIITPIALDHVHILGDNLAQIASEKAGIISGDAPALTAPQSPEAMQVLQETANRHQTTLHAVPNTDYDGATIRLHGHGSGHNLDFRGPDYQAANITTVASSLPLLRDQGWQIEWHHLARALENWQWRGRYQKLQYRSDVILDGAHNPHALTALLDNLQERQSGPAHVVFSAIHTKDAGQMIAELEARAASVHLCPSSVGKSLPAQALRELSPRLPVYETAEEALDAATSKAQADGGLALVTGSLFLVADLLHHITGEPRDPGVVS